MSDLSVFIDESGDVGADSSRYLVTLVFHEQSRPIDRALVKLGGRLRDLGLPLAEAVHAGPIIRREGAYSGMGLARRIKIFRALFDFAMGVDFAYATLAYRKSELGAGGPGDIAPLLQARIARDLEIFLDGRLAYFTGFDRVVVYYDNGQDVVRRAVHEAFAGRLFGAEFRRVVPSDYRLFQVADLVCTLELLRAKDAAGELSRSELSFFGSPGRLRRNYLRHIERRRLA